MFTGGRQSLETSFYRLCWQFICCCNISDATLEVPSNESTNTTSSSNENFELNSSHIHTQQPSRGPGEAIVKRPASEPVLATVVTVVRPSNETITLGVEGPFPLAEATAILNDWEESLS